MLGTSADTSFMTPTCEDVAEIIKLLDEAHPHYAGQSDADIVLQRSELLLALAELPPSEDAAQFLIEELETPQYAQLTATAAYVVDALDLQGQRWSHALAQALEHMWTRDDLVRIPASDCCSGKTHKVALTDQLIRALRHQTMFSHETLDRLVRLSSVCGPALSSDLALLIENIKPSDDITLEGLNNTLTEKFSDPPTELLQLQIQDQDGQSLTFGEFFTGRPVVVTFFYTRCENLTKCPATIRRLGELQQALKKEGLDDAIATAAITYDPEYDTPERLEQYRRSWGAIKLRQHRLFRTIDSFSHIQDYFAPGVGYGQSTVNRHRLDTYILDTRGRIAHCISRRPWTIDEILAATKNLR